MQMIHKVLNMRKRLFMIICSLVIMLGFGLAGCGSSSDSGLEDGTYVADFTTDHPMFHVNDFNNDKGILTVKDGEMTIHVSLQSKKIVNLFAGTSEDAQKEGAQLIEPTIDHIDYGDGYAEDVYGFDIPVPALDEEFDVALIGTHGNWYDHKVVVSNPVPGDDIHAAAHVVPQLNIFIGNVPHTEDVILLYVPDGTLCQRFQCKCFLLFLLFHSLILVFLVSLGKDTIKNLIYKGKCKKIYQCLSLLTLITYRTSLFRFARYLIK